MTLIRVYWCYVEKSSHTKDITDFPNTASNIILFDSVSHRYVRVTFKSFA